MEHGKIEHGHYVQGPIKFAVDVTDAHKTFDAVAALSNADKIKLAQLNNITAEPFNKQALTTILKSVVQNAWFANKLGTTPAEVITAHNARLARYNAELALPSSTVDFLSRKTRAVSATRKVLLFTIDEAKYEADWKNWRSQRYLVIKTMLELGAKDGQGKSVRDIYDNCNETQETTKPTKNAIGQILNALSAAGIARCINPEDAKKKAEKKASAAPKAPSPTPKKKK